MIEKFNLQKLAGADEIAGHFDVGFARGGVAGGVIVLCDAPVYVQSGVPGADVPASPWKKGVSCLKANRSCGLGRTRLFAN